MPSSPAGGAAMACRQGGRQRGPADDRALAIRRIDLRNNPQLSRRVHRDLARHLYARARFAFAAEIAMASTHARRRTLLDDVAAQARAKPSSPALHYVDGAESLVLTYAQLISEARAVARGLILACCVLVLVWRISATRAPQLYWRCSESRWPAVSWCHSTRRCRRRACARSSPTPTSRCCCAAPRARPRLPRSSSRFEDAAARATRPSARPATRRWPTRRRTPSSTSSTRAARPARQRRWRSSTVRSAHTAGRDRGARHPCGLRARSARLGAHVGPVHWRRLLDARRRRDALRRAARATAAGFGRRAARHAREPRVRDAIAVGAAAAGRRARRPRGGRTRRRGAPASPRRLVVWCAERGGAQHVWRHRGFRLPDDRPRASRPARRRCARRARRCHRARARARCRGRKRRIPARSSSAAHSWHVATGGATRSPPTVLCGSRQTRCGWSLRAARCATRRARAPRTTASLPVAASGGGAGFGRATLGRGVRRRACACSDASTLR